MENIDNYIQQVKEYIKQNPFLTQDMIVRYVFLDLCKRLSFDMDYIPFGNSRKRQQIYKEGFYPLKVDKCLENNKVICNSGSKLLELILLELNIDIKTVKAKGDIRKYPHVYNIVKTDKEYIVDLQEDMYRVQMHSKTPNYGLNENNKYTISLFEQEQMDRKLGYISNDNYYIDEYLYLLKNDLNYIEDFYEKTKFLLENIDVFKNDTINYINRQWYHVKILELFFNKELFDYEFSTGKIKIIDCYKENNKKIYVNCITVEDKGLTHIFVYNKQNYCYKEIDINYFVNSIEKGLILSKNKIKEVEKILRKR